MIIFRRRKNSSPWPVIACGKTGNFLPRWYSVFATSQVESTAQTGEPAMLVLPPPQSVMDELSHRWFPGAVDSAVDQVIRLLESASPLLISGCFCKLPPQGCLATQIAWHHPKTSHLGHDAGIVWLDRIANLSPVTSHVLTYWDARGAQDVAFRHLLLDQFRGEKARRQRFGYLPIGSPTFRQHSEIKAC